MTSDPLNEVTAVFHWLDQHREQRVEGGFGPALKAQFNFDNGKAQDMLTAWVQTYNKDMLASERAEIALERIQPRHGGTKDE
jgi:hypothetical protein